MKQIRAINDERDAKDDAAARLRASMPRQVKSRPTSSIKPLSSVDIFFLSSSSPEHSDDDVILTPELTGRGGGAMGDMSKHLALILTNFCFTNQVFHLWNG